RITVLMAMSAGFIAFTVSWASPPVPHEFISLPVLANAALSVADEPVMARKLEQPFHENTLLASAISSRRTPEALDVADESPLTLMAFADEPGTPSPSSKPAKRRDDTMIDSVQSRNEKSEQLIVARNSSAVINLKQQADGVEISDPAIADVVLTSPTRVIVTGKTFGTTQLVLRVGDQQRTIAVSVELDLRHLQAMIHSMAPTADVHTRSINGVVVLMGSVPDADTAERVAELAALAQGGEVKNQLTVAGVQQTMLRVVVAEVNKTALRTLGVNWAMGGADWTRDFFFANNINQINPTAFSSSGLPNVRTGQLTYGVAGVANGPGSNVTFGFPRGEFQMFLNALRENQLARVLAEPNLVAISGQTATFLAGGEVPIPVTQGGAVAGSITIEYKEFGVRLGFTPTVLAGQIIRLHVMSEVSDAVPGGSLATGLPLYTFTTRRVESTIECGNGQTFAMAGLLREQVRSVASKLPALGDLPVLGALFSSVRYQKDDTELVVLVTPQLVEPLEPHQVAPPPGALMRDPNDYELFALGQLEGQPQQAVQADGVPRDTFPPSIYPSRDSEEAQVAIRGPWGMAESDSN
ncbi:MAG TPA: type II and III secretion system protein family protein, partial [Phycisphaerae bacterium]|nr:type II and III secretion system protein family protein [Phycisphaerae bacterium]